MFLSAERVAQVKPDPVILTLVRDRVVEIVAENPGVRETELTRDIINDLLDDPFCDGISTEMILAQIQRVIREGRVIGVDCQMGDHGCTFLFPPGTQIKTLMPITDRQTRH